MMRLCGEDPWAPTLFEASVLDRDAWRNMLLQMTTELPSGDVLDYMLAEHLPGCVELARTVKPEYGNVGGMPLPTWASPELIARLQGHLCDKTRSSPYLLSFVAGMRDPAALARIDPWLDDPDIAWAVVLNPVSRDKLAELYRHALDVALGSTTPVPGTLLGAAWPSAATLPRRVTYAAYSAGEETTGESLGALWHWQLRPHGCIAVALLPEAVDARWRQQVPHAIRFDLPAEFPRESGRQMLPCDWAELAEDLSVHPLLDAETARELVECGWLDDYSCGGQAMENPWLWDVARQASRASSDRLLLAKPVLGRHVARALRPIAGDDLALWRAAITLLDEREGTLDEWLRLVDLLR